MTSAQDSWRGCASDTCYGHRGAGHLICDNYATHKTEPVRKWLAAHPRFYLHFTPTSGSWLNLVERWFAELTRRKLQRSTHRSVKELETDVNTWIECWNEDPKPFVDPDG